MTADDKVGTMATVSEASGVKLEQYENAERELFAGIEAAGREASALDVAEEHAKAQAFFAELEASTRVPHFGDQARDVIKALLLRATERGLYTP